MEAPNNVNKALGREHAIRKGSLKLISLHHPKDGNFHQRLFDLSTDLKEQHNLISDARYKEAVTEMLQRLIMYTGPDTLPDAPFCNLKYCGSPQAFAHARLQKNKNPVATPTFLCPDQVTTTSRFQMEISTISDATATASPRPGPRPAPPVQKAPITGNK